MTEYDFIIIGAGAAGLMLADGLGKDPAFRNKSILLLDKDDKSRNDRTWCIWEKGIGPFDQLIHKEWKQIYFGGKKFKKSLNIAPYSYKMIRGVDFYSHFKDRLGSYSNISFVQATVSDINEHSDGKVVIKTSVGDYSTVQVFNSWFSYGNIRSNAKYPVLQQHFIGWFVKSEEPVFTPGQATFMDFSIEQKGNTRFMYVLPFSEKEALVEYTLFSSQLLEDKEYEEAIQDYMLSEFNCSDYRILEKEKGSIPMTCYDFSQHNSKSVFHIGTAGGWSKPSTGYTFNNTSKKTEELIAYLKTGNSLEKFHKKDRFWYYDLLLLNILYRDNELGHRIFESLFKHRKPQLIFKFLDEETKWYEDIYIMMAPNPIPFIKSLVRHLYWAITAKKKWW
ncbi:lycopene cyclase family protein [Muriicola soli]|uniref:Lycopene cyclase n=1 Tax=Muriicola soli TaxID=2507538 RepID=A0A411E623_9FLAO|nr:lycopene cyclase family protein [Muriicola soli]QBA63111.1 lycopene cyclase [Muriicola soli]